MYTLGWNDEVSPLLEVEDDNYDCYIECETPLDCLGAPSSQNSFPTPTLPSWHAK
jgi:hypothetical protein